MDKYSFNSGSANPNNDGLKFNVAMDPGSHSTLIIRNVSGSGVINYLTDSDYLYHVSRVPYREESYREVDSSFSTNLSYPSGVSIIPGKNVCVNASSRNVESIYRLPVGSRIYSGQYSNKQLITGELLDDESNYYDVAMDGFEYSNLIDPEEFFQSGWAVSGGLRISFVESVNESMPFIDIENMDTSSGQIARMDIYSSELNGSFFNLTIENDITATGIPGEDYISEIEGDPSEFNKKQDEIEPLSLGGQTELKLIEEWNSLFSINRGTNIEDEFSNGKGRDEVFIDAVKKFLDKNWDTSMKQFLWGDIIGINEVRNQLTVKSAPGLRMAIFFQLYYYGASDDIKILSEYMGQKQRLGKTMDWHMGLGGTSKVSGKTRKLKQEYTYMSTSRSYKKIYKVYDMPPRNSFTATSESNEAMFDNIGEGYIEEPKVISGFYPLYFSRSYAESEGGGFADGFIFNEKEYYMPSGLVSGSTYFHGDYDPQVLISYLNEQDFDLSGTYEESGSIEIEQGGYGYSDPVALYQEESYVETGEDAQEEDVPEISGQLGYDVSTGSYAPVVGIDDPEVAQNIAEQTFLIDFFNEQGI